MIRGIRKRHWDWLFQTMLDMVTDLSDTWPVYWCEIDKSWTQTHIKSLSSIAISWSASFWDPTYEFLTGSADFPSRLSFSMWYGLRWVALKTLHSGGWNSFRKYTVNNRMRIQTWSILLRKYAATTESLGNEKNKKRHRQTWSPCLLSQLWAQIDCITISQQRCWFVMEYRSSCAFVLA